MQETPSPAEPVATATNIASTPKGRHWATGCFLRSVKYGLILVLVLLLAHRIWLWRAQAGLDAEVAKLAAAGTPLTIASLAPPAPDADADNAPRE